MTGGQLRTEGLRFLVAGALNTGATLVLYWLLLLVVPYWLAYSIAYVVGIGVSYFLNTRFVFRVAPTARSAAMYPLVYVVQYLAGLGALRAAVEWFGLPRSAGILASIAVTIPLTFILSRLLLRGGRPS